jgi:molybdate transport system permease protein
MLADMAMKVESAKGYDLQGEIYKEKWVNIQDQPFPWYVHLDPLRLILMQ